MRRERGEETKESERKMKSPAENMHRNLLHVFLFLTHYIRATNSARVNSRVFEQINLPKIPLHTI